MISGELLLVATLAALSFFAVEKTVEGAKKAGRQVSCIARTGHTCKAPQTVKSRK